MTFEYIPRSVIAVWYLHFVGLIDQSFVYMCVYENGVSRARIIQLVSTHSVGYISSKNSNTNEM